MTSSKTQKGFWVDEKAERFPDLKNCKPSTSAFVQVYEASAYQQLEKECSEQSKLFNETIAELEKEQQKNVRLEKELEIVKAQLEKCKEQRNGELDLNAANRPTADKVRWAYEDELSIIRKEKSKQDEKEQRLRRMESKS